MPVFHFLSHLPSQDCLGSKRTGNEPSPCKFMFYFLKDFIYLFTRDTHRGRDIGRGRSRLHAGSPMRDLIPGLQDHCQRQMLNHWATQASLGSSLTNKYSCLVGIKHPTRHWENWKYWDMLPLSKTSHSIWGWGGEGQAPTKPDHDKW